MDFISKTDLMEMLEALPDDTMLYLGYKNELMEAFGGDIPEESSVILEDEDMFVIAYEDEMADIGIDENSKNVVSLSSILDNIDNDDIPTVTCNFNR